MAAVTMVGPVLEGIKHLRGAVPCPMCLMYAKQMQWTRNLERIEAHHELPETEKQLVIAWPPELEKHIRPGYYRGVPGDSPSMGIIDGLCWDHLAGYDPDWQAKQAAAQRRQNLANGNGGGPVPPGLRGRG